MNLATLTLLFALLLPQLTTISHAAEPVRLGIFTVDATPPVGSPLAYNRMERKGSTLWLKGIVLLGDEQPIVMVAVDWIGIGGAGHDRFRAEIAKAVGTTPERVAVHCLHQHDAPRCDFGAEELLIDQGLSGQMVNIGFVVRVIRDAAKAAKNAAKQAQPITHVGVGQSRVHKVASNRRILGADGKVKHVRWTATADPKIRAFPEGTIDPLLKSISFYNDAKLLGVVTYYATHPQSYYQTGAADTDFPGMAREIRQQATGATHIHFNGAGGNIGAGKYNDGSHENRPVLARRVAQGMNDAFAATEKFAVTADDLDWQTVKVALPVSKHLKATVLHKRIADKNATTGARIEAACISPPQFRRPEDRYRLPDARQSSRVAHAGRTVCGIPTCRSGQASQLVCRNDSLWRLFTRLHRHRSRIL